MKKKTNNKKTFPFKPSDVPVTQGMLYLVRDELKSNIKEVKADIISLEARLASQIHRLGVLMEEQNSKNTVVLDGLSNLFHRQERFEGELTQQGKILASLVK